MRQRSMRADEPYTDVAWSTTVAKSCNNTAGRGWPSPRPACHAQSVAPAASAMAVRTNASELPSASQRSVAAGKRRRRRRCSAVRLYARPQQRDVTARAVALLPHDCRPRRHPAARGLCELTR
jgi:hypothetical protein